KLNASTTMTSDAASAANRSTRRVGASGESVRACRTSFASSSRVNSAGGSPRMPYMKLSSIAPSSFITGCNSPTGAQLLHGSVQDGAHVRFAQAHELRDGAIVRARAVFQREQLAFALRQLRHECGQSREVRC